MSLEELNLMRESPVVANVSVLCDEVERLHLAVTEARAIIEHIGFDSSSRMDVIRLANAWMKENP